MEVYSARQLQELRILRLIKRVLLGMELLNTRDVLASDDLYPASGSFRSAASHKQLSNFRPRTNMPTRSSSMYVRASRYNNSLGSSSNQHPSEDASTSSPSCHNAPLYIDDSALRSSVTSNTRSQVQKHSRSTSLQFPASLPHSSSVKHMPAVAPFNSHLSRHHYKEDEYSAPNHIRPPPVAFRSSSTGQHSSHVNFQSNSIQVTNCNEQIEEVSHNVPQQTSSKISTTCWVSSPAVATCSVNCSAPDGTCSSSTHHDAKSPSQTLIEFNKTKPPQIKGSTLCEDCKKTHDASNGCVSTQTVPQAIDSDLSSKEEAEKSGDFILGKHSNSAKKDFHHSMANLSFYSSIRRNELNKLLAERHTKSPKGEFIDVDRVQPARGAINTDKSSSPNILSCHVATGAKSHGKLSKNTEEDAFIGALLDGRSLFACSSKSPLYFCKTKSRLIKKV